MVDEDVDLVVIDRGFDGVAFVVVVETWAVAAKPVGEVAGDGELDEALKVGFEWARKAARKLAKKGLLVGIATDDSRRVRDFEIMGVRTPIDGVFLILSRSEPCNVTSFHPLFGRRLVDWPARLLGCGMQVY